ncbi:uncharacterized protein si:dkey-260g12.1 [Melanotaenia boesemani]|uniref:uncharacterized protein si:dkey-260g12.1 n=1 Tax=Melanotaenia boesemani TaxID=1250792 RepID=UPI001C0573D1|nr:uncharacterized protein si:dkey-260g12.1 [Melanotaenia boesemani]
MGFVQYFVAVLVLSAQLVLTYPTRTDTEDNCVSCPAGEFQKSCIKCQPCPNGSYVETTGNHEENCHLCFRDCLPKYHLRVIQNCSSTTPLKCDCEPGFRCIDKVVLSDNCRKCEKIENPKATAVISDRDKQTFPPPSLVPTKPYQSPKYSVRAVPTAYTSDMSNLDNTNSQLAAILGPVIFLGCMAIAILLHIHRPRNQTRFRQTLAKLCNEGQDSAHKSKESTHPFPRDSFSAKQQPSSVSAASLGSVQIHSPGTVIFSFLSQFTGQVGPTILSGKRPESVSNEEEDEKECPVFHPTSSPSVHLSEEERSIESDNIFSPFQEQGKDCHVSKEEVL